MFNYTCLNPIAQIGLDNFSGDYAKVDDLKDADAALVRSAAMHDMELGDRLVAVARAGAGVNNIPLKTLVTRIKGVEHEGIPGGLTAECRTQVISDGKVAAEDKQLLFNKLFLCSAT